MKKLFSRLLVFVLLANLFAPAALAAGASGNTYSGLGYEDVVLSPSGGASFANTSPIEWQCSGHLFNEKLHSLFGWLSGMVDSPAFRISEICLELYELGENGYWLDSIYTDERYKDTLFSISYNNVSSVRFSESGATWLDPGKYRLHLKAMYGFGYTTVCSSTFGVYDDTPQPKYASVTVIHELMDGSGELSREIVSLESGVHTLYADYPVGDDYDVWGPSSLQVYVDANGFADMDPVVFQYTLVQDDCINDLSPSEPSFDPWASDPSPAEPPSVAAQYRRNDFVTGNYVCFGRFEQDGNFGNGSENILWQVLTREGDRALLLSYYCLQTMPYHQRAASDFIPWADCTLRVWLNNSFLSTAFTAAECAAIQTTTVSTPWMQEFNIWPGPDAQDQVFILSYQEVERYLSSWAAWPTQWACQNGALVNNAKNGTTYWWLRSPNKPGKVSIINSSSHLWYSSVGDADGTVRPAIWVDLNNPIFE